MNWIKVTDGLPEENQRVLAIGQSINESQSDDLNGIELVDVTTELCKYGKGWVDDDFKWIHNTHCCVYILVNVTHWMALPEKPQ